MHFDDNFPNPEDRTTALSRKDHQSADVTVPVMDCVNIHSMSKMVQHPLHLMVTKIQHLGNSSHIFP